MRLDGDGRFAFSTIYTGHNSQLAVFVANTNAVRVLVRANAHDSPTFFRAKLNPDIPLGSKLDSHPWPAIVTAEAKNGMSAQSTLAAGAEELGTLCAELVNQRKAPRLDVVRGSRAG